jgi:hypothetical protein
VFKSVVILYLVVFSSYVFFSRQPDFMDGEKATATIHFQMNNNAEAVPMALFTLNKVAYTIRADYLFRNFKEGTLVTVIYENANPQKAKVYTWWGYWFTSGELAFSIIILLISYFAAHSITSNPTPDALKEQMEYQPERKTKYDL